MATRGPPCARQLAVERAACAGASSSPSDGSSPGPRSYRPILSPIGGGERRYAGKTGETGRREPRRAARPPFRRDSFLRFGIEVIVYRSSSQDERRRPSAEAAPASPHLDETSMRRRARRATNAPGIE